MRNDVLLGEESEEVRQKQLLIRVVFQINDSGNGNVSKAPESRVENAHEHLLAAGNVNRGVHDEEAVLNGRPAARASNRPRTVALVQVEDINDGKVLVW